eukprot:COSAG06_NODE_7062_length_2650_cov_5.934522_2_plen_92_part_00
MATSSLRLLTRIAIIGVRVADSLLRWVRSKLAFAAAQESARAHFIFHRRADFRAIFGIFRFSMTVLSAQSAQAGPARAVLLSIKEATPDLW